MTGEPFRVGVNYWPRRKAMYWWKDFDRGEVADEFDVIAGLGMSLVRIFLLWEDFQPAPDRVSAPALADLETVCDVAAERGLELPEISVAVRTGDTPQRERQRMLRNPPDVLITTPESLFLLLTSRGREMLAGVRSTIVDEIHAVAGTKRGTHLSLSLERLEQVVDDAGGAFQRISAEYDLTDSIQLSGGFVFYTSGDLRRFQNIGDNDRLFLGFRYSF